MGRLQKKKDPEKKRKQAAQKARRRKAGEAAKNSGKVQPLRSAQGPAPRAQAPARTAPQKANVASKGVQFLREVKVELKKVTWPTRKQAVGSTVVVIILVLIFSGFLGVVDITLSNLVRLVLG
ncbi:MAG: preprotein translocase subunit SecE [Deltaproteobacteria bacterium]|nr:preprotein translocase subunit SecE [Deltaproteobacteria bacterium]